MSDKHSENGTENLNEEELNSENQASEESSENSTGEQSNTNETSSIGEEIEKLQMELGQAKDKHLRLYSEFENFRRRTAKEKIEHTQLANKNLLSALLPVLDDFERAQGSIEQADTDEQKAQLALDAIDILQKRFKTALEQQGAKEMESPIGKELDTDLHEAITAIPATSDEQKGKIIDQVEKGYYLHDKVLRFAKVVVAK